MTHRSTPFSRTKQDEQLHQLRFVELLHDTIVGCRNELDVCGSTVHRLTAEFGVEAACIAAYDQFRESVEIVHSAGKKVVWDEGLLVKAAQSRHAMHVADTLALPVLFDGVFSGDGGKSGLPHVWGVVAVYRKGEANRKAFSALERQTLRTVAQRVGEELERRRVAQLDDVLDSLLRKTKPIDVYTHTLREVRRFVRYDHSASVMTMQRGMAQLTVRTEKAVRVRGQRDTLSDSPRRGKVIRLTSSQAAYVSEREEPFVLSRSEDVVRLNGAPDTLNLWSVLGVEETAGSVLCYPLVFGDQVLGILRLAATRPGSFDPGMRYGRLLSRFARLLAVTLYRSELYFQSDHQLQAIKQIGRAITSPVPVEQICQQVLHLALRVMHVQVGVLGLLRDGRLELVAHQGCTEPELPVIRPGDGIAAQVLASGQSRAVADVTRVPEYVVFNSRVRSELISPITYNGEVLGILGVASFEQGHFRDEDEEAITFLEALANQAAIAIRNAQMHFDVVRRLGPAVPIDATLSAAGLQDFLVEELHSTIDRLAAANERLALANDAKSEFLARMSHDLRGPLNVIIGLADLLTDSTAATLMTPEKERESLVMIRDSGEVLASMIGNILDLSALEAGKVQLSPITLDAPATFSYLQAMSRSLAENSGKALDIVLSLDPQLGRLVVDEEKFFRIVLNLIANAVKFTPSGGTVEIVASCDGPEGDTLLLVVRDTGIGIPAEYHQAIFEPFRRLQGQGGTGLGLAVVQQLVGLHGGQVWVESTPGQGSAFHVLLPGAVAHTPQPPLAAPPSPGVDDRGLILVVEDTEAHMNLMRLAVTSRGYAMHGVTSGEDALAWLADHRPDVILLDMQLPGMDGFAVAAHLKSQTETYHIPIVAVTAEALAENEARARASGCDAYVTKPIDLSTLLATVEALAR